MSRGKRWPADQGRTAGIQFEGAPDLLRLIAWLCRRPWRYWSEHRLPVIRLIRPPGGPDPLAGLEEWLNSAHGVIPFARVNAEDSTRQPAVVEDLLDLAVTNLVRDFGRGRRLRFPHYGLALWLLHLDPLQPGTAPDEKRDQIAQWLQIHLRKRLGGNQFGETLAEAVGDFPWWVRLAARTMPRVGLVLMRSSWRPPRWFARQPIAKAHLNSFYSLALAFATPEFAADHRDEVDRLLVDAFLRDLRVAYRRTSVLGAGRRRTSYPVLLVDAGPAPAEDLLTMIEASRSMTTRRRFGARSRPQFDPLLVITDPAVALQPAPGYHPLDARPAYDAWLHRQQPYSRNPTGFLELTLPAETGRPGALRDLVDVGLPRPRLPWMAVLLPIVLVATLAGAAVANNRRCEQPWSAGTHQTLQREPLGAGTTQCVGLSDGGYRFFDDPPGAQPAIAAQLRSVEAYITATNKTVVKNPKYVSVVYLSTLSNTTLGGYQAALEELRGLALAQREMTDDDVPIRLLLANGGDQMNYGGRAAQLIAGAKDRLRIVAVTGLGISREGVQQAVLELDTAGIPTLGTLLSADQLTSLAATYHQVGPANLREAAVAAFYAKEKKHVTESSMYYAGDPTDLYSANLAEDVRAAFVARGIAVREFAAYRTGTGTPGADVTSLGQQACPAKPGYLVFFAGRPDEFGKFLLGMRGRCPAAYPMMLAGDAITEFVLAGRQANFPGLPLDYLSPASGVAWGPDCAAAQSRERFFTAYHDEGFGPPCDIGEAGRAMFGYDALQTVQAAITRLRTLNANPAQPGALLQGLTGLRGTAAVAGVTGVIDFDGTGRNAQVPVDKAMLVIGTGLAAKPVLRLLCGAIPTGLRPSPGCPSDSTG
jgi:ABC-type branched-subunit amino acid transport system substrate-binding protein